MNLLKKYKLSIIIALLGAIGGFLYWNFIGCASGSCAITSVWWRSTIYGAVIGWLLGSIIESKSKKTMEDE